jgi:hypothetical protein
LLYLVGDAADVSLMWQAKHIDMDTGFGFDVEFLLGAGVNETIKYLRANGRHDIADELVALTCNQSVDHLLSWERFRIDYFYPA